jgi:hypothetical protein
MTTSAAESAVDHLGRCPNSAPLQRASSRIIDPAKRQDRSALEQPMAGAQRYNAQSSHKEHCDVSATSYGM